MDTHDMDGEDEEITVAEQDRIINAMPALREAAREHPMATVTEDGDVTLSDEWDGESTVTLECDDL